MKKFLPLLIAAGVLLIGYAFNSYYVTGQILGADPRVLTPRQGGTGLGTATAGDVGKVLKVLDDDPFTYEFATDATGAGGGTYPFTSLANGVQSTTSVMRLSAGSIHFGSSTFAGTVTIGSSTPLGRLSVTSTTSAPAIAINSTASGRGVMSSTNGGASLWFSNEGNGYGITGICKGTSINCIDVALNADAPSTAKVFSIANSANVSGTVALIQQLGTGKGLQIDQTDTTDWAAVINSSGFGQRIIASGSHTPLQVEDGTNNVVFLVHSNGRTAINGTSTPGSELSIQSVANLSNGTSTFYSNLLTNNIKATGTLDVTGTAKFTAAPVFSSLTGVLKGNGASPLTVAANGTDFTLITATTCGGTDKVSAIDASGNVTCSADQTGAGGSYPFVVGTTFGTTTGFATTSQSLWLQGGAIYASTTATSTFDGGLQVPGLSVSKAGSIAVPSLLQIWNTGTQAGQDSIIGFGGYLGNYKNSIVSELNTGGGTSDLIFNYGSGSYTALTEGFRLAGANGRVGIASSTPGTILSVQGAANFSGGTSTIYSNLLTGNFTASSTLTVSGSALFSGAARFTSTLEIPNGTNPTATNPGQLAHDTTDNQLILDDFVIGKATERIFSVTVASTSPYFIGGTNLAVPTELDGYTITAIRCHTVSGTSKPIAITDGTNPTEAITCDSDGAADDGSITNGTVTAGEQMFIDFGATTGAVDTVSITVFGQWTRE